MALKITTQISTDKGVTSEAYVRIVEYVVSKYGHARFRHETYLSEADAPVIGAYNPTTLQGSAKNFQIGEETQVSLLVQVPVTLPEGTEEGAPVTPPVPAPTMVPDLSPVEEGNIFEYGYGELKKKLVALYGAENVVDC